MNKTIEEKLKTLPDYSGVYLMKDKDNNIIYMPRQPPRLRRRRYRRPASRRRRAPTHAS